MRYTFPILIIFSIFFLAFSCKKEKTDVNVSKLISDVKINRFDREFANVDFKIFPALKTKYPLLFPDDRPDSAWVNFKNDSLFQLLHTHIDSTYKDFNKEKKELDELFKNVKYYYPSFKTPDVITLISLLDYDHQVIFTDSILILSLDTFLGKNRPYYIEYPDYLRTNLEPSRLIFKVAEAVANETAPKTTNTLFFEKIIALGKIKFAVQHFLPNKTETQIMNYAPERMEWAKNNEYYIWQFFIEKNYLYDRDKELERRFIDPAPFSKFYIENDAESPGQIGIWLGWQIVRSYAVNTGATLTQIMATSPEEIFKKSKYKPSK